jgi:hypothetical protein
VIELGAKRFDLGRLFLRGERGKVELIVDPEHAVACRCRERVHAGPHSFEQRCEEVLRLRRQGQPGVMTGRLHVPALGGQEQALATPEAQGMLEPHRAIANCSAPSK